MNRHHNFPWKVNNVIHRKFLKTRMHSNRMRTTQCIDWPYLVEGGMHTMHAPLHSPHMPPPPLPCMPPFATHAPLCHACPALCHACPPSPCTPPFIMNTPFTTHAPLHHACPHFATHTPPPATPPQRPCTPQPHMPPVNRITDRCKNITFTNYVCGR